DEDLYHCVWADGDTAVAKEAPPDMQPFPFAMQPYYAGARWRYKDMRMGEFPDVPRDVVILEAAKIGGLPGVPVAEGVFLGQLIWLRPSVNVPWPLVNRRDPIAITRERSRAAMMEARRVAEQFRGGLPAGTLGFFWDGNRVRLRFFDT